MTFEIVKIRFEYIEWKEMRTKNYICMYIRTYVRLERMSMMGERDRVRKKGKRLRAQPRVRFRWRINRCISTRQR